MFTRVKLTASLLFLFAASAPTVASAAGSTGAAVRRTTALVGTIHGKVTEAETGQPVVSAQVTIVGAGQRVGAITDANGNYTIRRVTAGTVTVRVTRMGYEPLQHTVTVADNGDATVNFALTRAAARLEEVVTTATGEMTRREMGNVVSSIRVDSVTKTAPITNMSEMLQGRAAGVQIIQGQGVIGSSPTIRIRGNSSISLSNEPLIVVDGIRYNNSSEPGNTTLVKANRFTLDPEEVESVDIIKGPSAAALYGTAAANGVVVIKTKRGRSGAARYTVFAENGLTNMPAKYPPNYWSWGRNIKNGVPQATPTQCKLANQAQGLCVIDSLTSYNPWTAPETDPWKNGPSQQYGLQVAGGTDALKFFVSADQQAEIGPYHMPSFEQSRIAALRSGSTPASQEIRPNQLHQNSFRGNFTFPISPTATAEISAGYQDRDMWSPFDGTFFAGLSNQMFSARGYKTPTNGTAREFVGDIFGVMQRTTLERFIGSGTVNWAPMIWLQLTGEGGIDNANSNNVQEQFPGQGTQNGSAWGPSSAQGYSGIDIYRTNTLQYTVNLRGTATRQLRSSLTSVTTLGGQYFKNGEYQLFGEGYGLGVGATTPTAAAQRLASTATTESATYGYFAQEQLNYAEKLFVTAAARTDLNSAFGRKVGNTMYPSGNLSYVISQERWFPRVPTLDRLRLRASMGQAGLQPGATSALAFLSPLTYPVGAGDVPGLTVQSVGNANLKPEVTTEIEGGFDAGLLNERLNVEFTAYNKTSRDQLFQRPLPPSYGVGGSQWVNIAKVVNGGQELVLDAVMVQSRPLTWNLRLNGSHNKNKLVNIGTIQLAQSQGARNVVGYPLFGLWDRPYTYNDANKDGIIVPSEITLADSDRYRGSTLPEYEAGMSNTLTLLGGRMSVSGLIDYRGKFWNSYTIGYNRAVSAGNAPEVNVPGSSLDAQAAAVAASTAALRNTRWGIFKPNDFIKLREISVSLNAPESFTTKYLHGRSAQLALSGRNLATLWTKYPGIDPEANRLTNGNDDLGTPPALRYFTARLNLGF